MVDRNPIHRIIAISVLALFLLSGLANSKNIFTRRYIWTGFDFLDRYNGPLYGYVDRAAAAGYNGLMIRAWFQDIETNPQKIKMIPKLKAYKAYAESKGMSVAPVSLAVLEGAEVDHTLADVLPVRDTPFLVSNGTANVSTDHAVALVNGGFEAANGHKPDGWRPGSFVPGANLFVDSQEKHSGNASLRVENPAGQFISQWIRNLKPYRAYQLAVWIKTENYTGSWKLGFMVQGSNMNVVHLKRDAGFGMWGVPNSQATWAKFVTDFNTLGYTQVYLSFMFGAGTGKIWIDDVAMQEVGLYETIRRTSCPVVVKSDDGSTTYTEGSDYTVRSSPYRISGTYQTGNELTIPPGSRIQNGAKLRVDWFQHGDVESYRTPVSYCVKKAFDIQMNTINALDKALDTTKALYAFIDEWRVGGYDPACNAFPTAGEYMGWVASVTDCQLRQNCRDRDVYVCNDMYDPYPNGHKASYFATRGGTIGSHNMVPSSMIILNWRNSDPVGNGMSETSPTYKSLRFFGGLDPAYPRPANPQIISPEYGAPNERDKWEWCMNELEKKGLTGVIGMAYVTWVGDYSKIETTAQFYKDAGRWGTGPIPFGDDPYTKPITPCNTSKIEKKPQGISNFCGASLKVRMGSGKLHYALKSPAAISLSLYDALGRRILLLEKGRQLPGTYSFNLAKLPLPAGLYVVSLITNDNGLAQAQHSRFVWF